jgi:urocanate hydratase
MVAVWASAAVSTPAWCASSRVLLSDPGMGVIRHADAGYQRAIDVADERGVRIPMREA